MKVHFSGWSNKYDEWVEENSPRLMRQWRRGQALQLNNRVDVQDVNKLLKQYQQMADMMKKVSKLGQKGLMRHGLGGLMPPNRFGG